MYSTPTMYTTECTLIFSETIEGVCRVTDIIMEKSGKFLDEFVTRVGWMEP